MVIFETECSEKASLKYEHLNRDQHEAKEPIMRYLKKEHPRQREQQMQMLGFLRDVQEWVESCHQKGKRQENREKGRDLVMPSLG